MVPEAMFADLLHGKKGKDGHKRRRLNNYYSLARTVERPQTDLDHNNFLIAAFMVHP